MELNTPTDTVDEDDTDTETVDEDTTGDGEVKVQEGTTQNVVDEHPEMQGDGYEEKIDVPESQIADKLKELEVRKLTLPSQGAVAELEKEYTPPVAYEPKEKTADDFRTSDDAQQAFLREEIDEDVFSQVVSKLGKPSNRTSDYRDRADLGFQRELPKWAFQTPRDIGPKVQELVEVMAIEEDERKYAQQLEQRQDPPYKEQQTLPHPM